MPEPRPWLPRRSYLLVSVSILVLALPGAAQDRGGIEDITITAKKRESTLQETAISVSAFSPTQLKDLGIENAVDLNEFTPNLWIGKDARGSGLVAFSRGIGLGDTGTVGRDPKVAIYIDGVYNGITIGSILDIMDLERVEVLRGPQGTLYGRNATGGAINFISRKPSGTWSLRSRANVGNRGRLDYWTSVDFPVWGGEEGFEVSDSLGVLSGNFSFATLNRDAMYGNNARDTRPLVPSKEIDEVDRMAFRGALRWDLPKDFQIDYAIDKHRIREASSEQALTKVYPPGGGVTGPALLGAFVPAFGFDMGEFADTDRPTHINVDSPGDDRIDVLGHALTITRDFAEIPLLDSFTLKSVTGYREIWATQTSDLDGTPYQILNTDTHTRKWQLSQDLNLVGNLDDGRTEYVLGYYYFKEKGREEVRQESLTDPALTGFGGVQLSEPRSSGSAHAVYANLGYTPPIFEDRLQVEGGIRYTYERRQGSNEITVFSGVASPLERETARDSFNEITPYVRLNYRPTEDLLTYASVTKGFSSGGFNTRAGVPAEVQEPFKEETVISYEAGFKWTTPDRRFRLNAAGFFMDFDDIQRTILTFSGTTIASTIQNAGAAEIWGAELEFLANPFDRIWLNGSAGLTIAEFREYKECVPVGTALEGGPACATSRGDPGVVNDFAGDRRFALTPRHTFNVGAQYNLPSFEWGDAMVRVDYAWKDDTWLQNGDNSDAQMDDFGLLSARIGLENIRLPGDWGHLDLGLWGKNLLDREYTDWGIDFQTNTGGLFPYLIQSFGERRTYGVELRWEFGGE